MVSIFQSKLIQAARGHHVTVSGNCNPVGLERGRGQRRYFIKTKRWSFLPRCWGRELRWDLNYMLNTVIKSNWCVGE
jgi:hypothetical protein